MGFTFAHSSQPVPSACNLPVSFSITASTSTDVWEKPPRTSSFNAPILYKAMPLRSFKRARVSIIALWTQLYDQGGLILDPIPSITNTNTHTTNGISPSTAKPQTQPQQWIKIGIDKPHLSVVAKDR